MNQKYINTKAGELQSIKLKVPEVTQAQPHGCGRAIQGKSAEDIHCRCEIFIEYA